MRCPVRIKVCQSLCVIGVFQLPSGYEVIAAILRLLLVNFLRKQQLRVRKEEMDKKLTKNLILSFVYVCCKSIYLIDIIS